MIDLYRFQRFLVEDPVALALAASWFFGLALVLTQFGLQHLSPRRGALVSIPTSTALLWVLAPFMLGGGGGNRYAVAIFLAVGLFFPASVTLLTFEANRRMGPSVTGALGNLTPLFAIGLAALLFGDVPRPLHAVGMAVIFAGVVLLSVDRRWSGGRWSVWVMALPLAAAAIRGATQPIAKFGLALWPSRLLKKSPRARREGWLVAVVEAALAGSRHLRVRRSRPTVHLDDPLLTFEGHDGAASSLGRRIRL